MRISLRIRKFFVDKLSKNKNNEKFVEPEVDVNSRRRCRQLT